MVSYRSIDRIAEVIVVGTSIACHLGEIGCQNAVVVEKNHTGFGLHQEMHCGLQSATMNSRAMQLRRGRESHEDMSGFS